MSQRSKAVKKWRKNAKLRLIRAFGGRCCVCGYDKCAEVFEFHHLNPSEKEITWGQMRSNIKGWNLIIVEMRKCIMVCSNCHKEIHAGVTTVPPNAPRFDESLSNYQEQERLKFFDSCPICGKTKRISTKTCSHKCSAKRRAIVDWSTVDVIALVNEYKTFEAVGDLFGITGAAVSRAFRKANENR